jgi:hypothetical protein
MNSLFPLYFSPQISIRQYLLSKTPIPPGSSHEKELAAGLDRHLVTGGNPEKMARISRPAGSQKKSERQKISDSQDFPIKNTHGQQAY